MKSKIPAKEKIGQVDFVLLIIIMCIMLFGFVMLFSASAPKAANGGIYKTLIRQGAILALGIGTLAFFVSIDYHMYRRYKKPIVLGTAVLMVLVPLIGFASHGATRQISLGFISFQPSEFAKIVLIIYYAARFSNKNTQNLTTDKENIIRSFGVMIGFCATCILQKHMSAAIVLALISIMMMIAAGFSLKLTAIGGTFLAAAASLFIFTEEYRANRIIALFKPFEHKQGIGWQIVQSLFAVGSGGLFGLGLGQSRQKYRYLPEAQNDYIYAVICEELGFIGGIAVIALFVLFVWRGMSIALKAKDKFGMYMAFGITSIIGLQMLINIGVVLSILPSTGMQLPLFSSGGSSMIATMWGMGILLNISKTSRIKKI